jgi:PilZ domain
MKDYALPAEPAEQEDQRTTMMVLDRRQTKRLIMRVPMWVRGVTEQSQREQGVESLNISLLGTYFAADSKFHLGDKIEVRLKMPEVVFAGQKTQWRFTGRVTHVDRLGPNGKIGVGVHFLYYSAGDKPPE